MRTPAAVLMLATATVIALPCSAAAHPLDLGYLRIDARSATVSIALDLHVHAAARLVGLEPSALDAAVLQRHASALADLTFRGAPLTSEHGSCRWTEVTATLTGQTANLTGGATCGAAPHTIRWAFPWVAAGRVSSTFQILVKAQLGGTERVAIVDKTQPAIELTGGDQAGFAAFVWTGVEHIGAAPDQWHGAESWKLPDGIDHILFLIALMLAGGTLFQILGIVSGFTLGHSITLALSALHVMRPPPQLIEPLIALSIAFVAAEAFVGKLGRHRWRVAACFGLIHGFGFASALNQLELATRDLVVALFGYNLGVELGQVAIVLVAAPLLLYLQRYPRLVRGLAAAIFAAGVYWLFQRLA